MDEVVEALEKYQGLVPLVYDIETMSLVEARSEDMQYAVYLKREADKVIAEKDAKIIQLTALIENYNRISGEIIDNANHQKCKRCVELADSCALRTVVAKMENRSFPTPKNSWRMFIYPKWRKRWLAIAEKFKATK